MTSAPCHLPNESPRDRAKALILKTLGVRRVAEWCGVAEDTVYQWLSRGTDLEPIPPARVPLIVRGARDAGLAAPLDILWPALSAAGAGDA